MTIRIILNVQGEFVVGAANTLFVTVIVLVLRLNLDSVNGGDVQISSIDVE
jgi:hypothetical protein